MLFICLFLLYLIHLLLMCKKADVNFKFCCDDLRIRNCWDPTEPKLSCVPVQPEDRGQTCTENIIKRWCTVQNKLRNGSVFHMWWDRTVLPEWTTLHKHTDSPQSGCQSNSFLTLYWVMPALRVLHELSFWICGNTSSSFSNSSILGTTEEDVIWTQWHK